MGLPRGELFRSHLVVITIRNIMKNREYLYRCIMPGMDIALLTTTNDIEQLRAMALAMVQKVVAEKNAELMAKDQRISLLEEALLLARQQRFGKKCETLTSMQRSLFEEDVDADIAAIEANLKAQLPRNADEKKSPSSRPVRKPLPANLERVTRVIEPEFTDCCPACQGELRHFRDEICEKLEFIPAKFVVNQYVRPQYSCAACEKVFSGQMPPHIIPKGIAESSPVWSPRWWSASTGTTSPCTGSSIFLPARILNCRSARWRAGLALPARRWHHWPHCSIRRY